MPELPEIEAWVRGLDEPVSATPVLKAGPAHIATRHGSVARRMSAIRPSTAATAAGLGAIPTEYTA